MSEAKSPAVPGGGGWDRKTALSPPSKALCSFSAGDFHRIEEKRKRTLGTFKNFVQKTPFAGEKWGIGKAGWVGRGDGWGGKGAFGRTRERVTLEHAGFLLNGSGRFV